MTAPLDLPPWPNVVGKRCLAVGAHDDRVADDLQRRGAADVVVAEAADIGPHLGRFEVAACVGLLPQHGDPVAVLAAVRPLVDVVLLSVEPIDPVLSVVGRGRNLFTLDGAGLHANGGGHRQLLARAGWIEERVSKPMLLDVDAAPPGRLGRLATRLLAGSGPGVLHRAILARPS